MPGPWSLDAEDTDFVAGLTQGIVGFTIDIGEIEGKWKLNQNHSVERRQRVVEGLRQRGRDQELLTAELMEQQLRDDGHGS